MLAVCGITHVLVLFSIHQVHIKELHLLPLRSMRIAYHIWTELPTQHCSSLLCSMLSSHKLGPKCSIIGPELER